MKLCIIITYFNSYWIGLQTMIFFKFWHSNTGFVAILGDIFPTMFFLDKTLSLNISLDPLKKSLTLKVNGMEAVQKVVKA